MDAVEHGLPDQLRGVAGAEQSQRSRVQIDEVPCAGEEDGFGRGVHQGPVAALVVLQRQLAARRLPLQPRDRAGGGQHHRQQSRVDQALALAAGRERGKRLVFGQADDHDDSQLRQARPGIQPRHAIHLARRTEQTLGGRPVTHERTVGRQLATHRLVMVAAARDERAVGMQHRNDRLLAQRQPGKLPREVSGGHRDVHRAGKAAVHEQRPVDDHGPGIACQARAHRPPDVLLVAAAGPVHAEVLAVGHVDALGGRNAVVDGVAVGVGHRHVADRAVRQRRQQAACHRVERRRIAAPLAPQLQQHDVDAAHQRLHLGRQHGRELLGALFGAQLRLALQFALRLLGLPPHQRGAARQHQRQHQRDGDGPAAGLPAAGLKVCRAAHRAMTRRRPACSGARRQSSGCERAAESMCGSLVAARHALRPRSTQSEAARVSLIADARIATRVVQASTFRAPRLPAALAPSPPKRSA